MKGKNFVIQLTGILLSGFLFFYASPANNHPGWISFFALVPLFLVALSNQSYMKNFLLFFLFYFIAMLLMASWLVNIHWVVWLIASLFYSLVYYGSLGILVTFLNKHFSRVVIFNFSFAWFFMEWVKSQGVFAFPFGNISQSLFGYPTFIQSASVLSEYFISFLIVLINISLAFAIKKRFKLDNWERASVVLAVILFIASYAFGFFRLNFGRPDFSNSRPINVLLVQPDVEASIKEVPKGKIDPRDPGAFISYRLDNYIDLTWEALEKNPEKTVDLIIWGESVVGNLSFIKKNNAVNLTEANDAQKLATFVRNINKFVLTGAYIYENQTKGSDFYNGTVLLSPDGKVTDHYEKSKLVLFGEYTPPYLAFLDPFSSRLSLTKKKISQSKNSLMMSETKMVTPICYENGFSGLIKELVEKNKADFIVNISDDGLFKDRRQAVQHMSVNVFRSLENGKSFVFLDNNGISGLASPLGIIDKENMLKGKGYIYLSLHKTEDNFALFPKFGMIVLVIASFAYFSVLVLSRIKSQDEKSK